MHPLTPGPFFFSSIHHPSTLPHTVCPPHSLIFVFPYAPDHLFFLPDIYKLYISMSFIHLHLGASVSLQLIFTHPSILHTPTHPSTTHPLTHHPYIHLSVHLYNHPFNHLLYIHKLPTYPPIHCHTTYPIHTPSTHSHIHHYISLSTHYPSIYFSIHPSIRVSTSPSLPPLPRPLFFTVFL